MVSSVSFLPFSLGWRGRAGIRAQHGSFVRAVCEDRGMKLPRPAALTGAGVTAREAEVLAAVGGRLTNQEIADRLFISVRTVESHVSALLRKLGQPGRPALIELARQLAAAPARPAPSTSFVGREPELAQLAARLAAGPLVSLTGPAG